MVIVSNRLPVTLIQERKSWQVLPSAGGLVSALGPVLRNRGGVWIGWPGVVSLPGARKILSRATKGIGYDLIPVNLSHEELENYYHGFSNEIIWPLFHQLQSLCNYDPAYWTAYRAVSRKFAKVIADHVDTDDYLWIHDYQIMLLGEDLRNLGAKGALGFFLHIPFPSPDIYMKLPWRRHLVECLLHFDLVGFQTNSHRNNFLQCLRALVPELHITRKGHMALVATKEREVRVGAFPIGIDYQSFDRGARTQEVEAESKNLTFALRNRTMILGVDRLDYTKGIPYKLDAMRNALERFPELRHKVTFIQVVVPSRQVIPQYEALKNEIEQMVGEINGAFAEPGWVPIQYIFRSLARTELLAYYRTAEIALVTPLDDGMNLVAKEYCASKADGNGVLILSEFAGAASQMFRGAMLVNPYDQTGVAEAIHQAYRMPPAERRERMQRLRRTVQQQDVFRWVSSFLEAGIHHDLSAFPQRELISDAFDDSFFDEID